MPLSSILTVQNGFRAQLEKLWKLFGRHECLLSIHAKYILSSLVFNALFAIYMYRVSRVILEHFGKHKNYCQESYKFVHDNLEIC